MRFPSVVPALCGQSSRRRIRVNVHAVAVLAAVVSFAALGHGRPTDAKADEPKASTAAKDSQADVKAIQDLVAKYAKSIDDADTTLAAKIWANSADVSFI